MFVPSIFGKVSGPVKQKKVTGISRYEQSIKQVRSGPSQTCVSLSPSLDQLQDVVIESPKTADTSVQATVQTIEKGICTSPEIKQTTQIVELNPTYPFTEDELEENYTKVRYYSLLPSFTALMTICTLYNQPQWKQPTQVSTVDDGLNETKIKFSESRSSIL